MAEGEYDIILDAKKRVNEPHNRSYEQAEAASEVGKLKLVDEIILEPYCRAQQLVTSATNRALCEAGVGRVQSP